MNFSVTTILFFLFFHLANANDIIQILFHDGSCESWEWDMISRTIYTMSMNQRHSRSLRSGENNHVTATEEGGDVDLAGGNGSVNRELVYPRYCANNCRGYATGRCMALNCYGYRQRRSVLESIGSWMGHTDRELYWSTGCNNQKSEVNNYLNNLQYQVGENCRKLLNSRTLECFSDVNC